MGLSYQNVNDISQKKVSLCFPTEAEFVEVNPGGVILPKKYTDIGDKIFNLPVRKDDVWLVSYPRTGSTWAQEMVWLLGHNLDFEGAKLVQQIRVPILELTALYNHLDWVTYATIDLIKTINKYVFYSSNSIGNSVECVEKMESPRYIRSHLPWNLLPKQISEVKPKIIYTARNPKDLCVSFYHYCKLAHELCGPFDDFCRMFIEETNPMGSYFDNVFPFWERRNDPNILFLTYEDMKNDIRKCIKTCAKFLEVKDLSDAEMDKVCEHLKFEQMQSNPAVNLEGILVPNNESNESINLNQKFIRKGQIGDWKNYISPELSAKFDDWIRSRTDGTGLEFIYE